MRFRAFGVFLLSCAIAIMSWVVAPPAWALTPIKLSELSYHECPPEVGQGSVLSGSVKRANCFVITGIYDANNDTVMQNRTRLGSIDEVPPGVSDFELRITVAANQPTPLKLTQFKASGFAGKVRR